MKVSLCELTVHVICMHIACLHNVQIGRNSYTASLRKVIYRVFNSLGLVVCNSFLHAEKQMNSAFPFVSEAIYHLRRLSLSFSLMKWDALKLFYPLSSLFYLNMRVTNHGFYWIKYI